MTSTLTSAGTPDPTRRRRTGLSGALTRRWPTGVGIAAATASLTVLAPLPDRAQLWIGAWCVLLAAVIYLTWGTARGDLDSPRLLTAQTAAVLAFGAVALTTVATEPAAARYVLAAGWIAHAIWDVVHHRIDRVVPRWYAETCLVADLSLATALLAVGIV